MKTVLWLSVLSLMSCSSKNIDDIKREIELAQKNQNVELQIKLYNEIIDVFPNTKDAITAEFQIAFIYNNYLKDYDEAEKRYSKFIDKYPDSDLVESAKYEIKTLRIPADELLLIDSLKNSEITK